ncbi:BPI/LBP/Plunc family like protein [Aduncisulcus paluster]|uniref:BPI/LBP/Plunc family like protein n=1 Tax=Aduncisulcus paluster TaxID=2918883 RepID=A0ABQ5KQU0_9EUKA|nr:BPI/LBP/Plunc family like protein [Aduncisulcus paluster]
MLFLFFSKAQGNASPGNENAGIRITLSHETANAYLNSFMDNIIKQITSNQVPDEDFQVNLGIAVYDVSFSSIEIESLKLPVDFNVAANNTIIVRSSGGECVVSCNFALKDQIYPYSYLAGSVRMDLEDPQLVLTANINISDDTHLPLVTNPSTSLELSDIIFDFSGDDSESLSTIFNLLMPTLMNLFGSLLSGWIDGNIVEMLDYYMSITSFYDQFGDKTVGVLPLVQNMYFYGAYDFSSPSFVNWSQNGYYSKEGSDGTIWCYDEPVNTDLPEVETDAGVQISIARSVIDSFTYSMWKSGSLDFKDISKPPSSWPNQTSFNTSGSIFQTFAPELYDAYPDSDLRITSTLQGHPLCTIGSTMVSFPFDYSFSIDVLQDGQWLENVSVGTVSLLMEAAIYGTDAGASLSWTLGSVTSMAVSVNGTEVEDIDSTWVKLASLFGMLGLSDYISDLMTGCRYAVGPVGTFLYLTVDNQGVVYDPEFITFSGDFATLDTTFMWCRHFK